MTFTVRAAEHTGITVSDLDRATAFWVDVLGCTLARNGRLSGDFAAEVTGVAGADFATAVLVVPGGHRIELLQYHLPADRVAVRPRPCDVGSVHVALIVDDIDAVLRRAEPAGWLPAGTPQLMTEGPRAGTTFTYLRDTQDGVVLELIQPPA